MVMTGMLELGYGMCDHGGTDMIKCLRFKVSIPQVQGARGRRIE